MSRVVHTFIDTSSNTLKVSGASGYLGGHIVNVLLSEGFNVRALARGSKVAALKEAYAEFGSRLEVFEIADISHDQFPAVFEGVDALIHAASPLSGTPEQLFKVHSLRWRIETQNLIILSPQ